MRDEELQFGSSHFEPHLRLTKDESAPRLRNHVVMHIDFDAATDSNHYTEDNHIRRTTIYDYQLVY